MRSYKEVKSTMQPKELVKTPNFIDYNYNIEEVEEINEVDKLDEFGNQIFDEEGNPVKEEVTTISYQYDSIRFDNEEEYNEWRENNL